MLWNFSRKLFVRWCRLELTVLAKREATQPKKKWKMRALNEKHSYDHKTKQQNPLTEQKNLLGHNRYYGVMVSNLDAEPKDPKINFSELLNKNSLFSWRRLQLTILAEMEATQPKNSWERAIIKKSFSWQQNPRAKPTNTTKASLRSQ